MAAKELLNGLTEATLSLAEVVEELCAVDGNSPGAEDAATWAEALLCAASFAIFWEGASAECIEKAIAKVAAEAKKGPISFASGHAPESRTGATWVFAGPEAEVRMTLELAIAEDRLRIQD